MTKSLSVNLHFKVVGEGFPFIILHGLYGMSDNWMSFAQRLAHKYKFYLLDLRNHGDSPHTKSHTYSEMVLDILNFVDSQGIERAIFLGHSMGGKAAMLFGLEYPERVSSLIIADIAPIDYHKIGEGDHYLQHRKIIDAMLQLPFDTLVSRREAELFLMRKINDYRVVQFLLKSIKRKGKVYSWRINIPIINEYLPKISAGFDTINYNPITSFPVLVIRGADSPYIVKDGEIALRRLFPMLKLKTIENAGHWLHAEQPEMFLKSIEEFLE